MKRTWIAGILLIAGCGKEDEKSCCGLSPEPAPAARNISRPAGVVLTGLPGSPELAACDARGRWGLKTPVIEHSIVDPKEKAPLVPAANGSRLTLYRDSLPFPQLNWKSATWEVTQLVFPFGKGFVVRYHVMNHGDEAGVGQLKVGAPEGPESPSISAADRPAAATLVFDLKIEPGVSHFIHVTTADLAGKIPDDALEQATAQWEKLIGDRSLKLPDATVVTNYYADVAGAKLGVSGCAEAVAKIEAMLVKKEGNALRLLPDIPDSWQLEAIEVREIPTEFGALSFRYQGVYNNRTIELKGCKPADGFLISVPEKLVPRIDGKDAAAKDGTLRIPAGASFVELSYPR